MSTTNELELPNQQKAAVAVSGNGLQLRTLDDIWRFAIAVSKSGLAPKGIATPEAVTVAIQMGLEVGLTPMAALQNIAVINGRPSLWGDAQLAVVRGTGELEEFSEWYENSGTKLPRNPTTYGDGVCAVVRVKRKGFDAVETSFSVADAKQAKLWQKAGPWSEYPARMLKFRARSFALRDLFGDALRGMKTVEELTDEPEIRTAAGRDVSQAAVGQIAASNPLARTTTAEPDPEPVVVLDDHHSMAPRTSAGRNFVNEADERAGLSFDIQETIKVAEITLPRFEGMAKRKGFLEQTEMLSGGALSIEKLRIIHEKRAEIAELPTVKPVEDSEGGDASWE